MAVRPKTVVADVLADLHALVPQLGDRLGDVITHQSDLVMLAEGPVRVGTPVAGGVYAEFAGPGLEDQPAVAGIDVRPAQHVAEEGPRRFGIVGVEQRVHCGDHERSVSTRLIRPGR